MAAVAAVEILAYGVRADEQSMTEAAFAGRYPVHCLEVFLNADTAPLAVGHEIVSTRANASLDAPRGGSARGVRTGHNPDSSTLVR
ncbi:hypothetical protein ABIA33_005195 [Streptacidiphilus sp. MAP12-16]|uniref:hypothetical protein n=1 Tax=Streptacidiphilus sp. MAP12-16 TaxID=3156300 RepID=UPI003512063B